MKKLIISVTGIIFMTTVVSNAQGSTNYWDNNEDAAGFGTANGTWGVDANWSSDSTGQSIPAVTNTTAADELFFGYDTNGLAAGTITVDSTNQSFRSITFATASESITLSGGTITLAAPHSSIRIDNVSDTIGSTLSGSNALHLIRPVALTYNSFLTTTPTIVYTNAVLADYQNAGAIMDGSSIPKQPVNAYHFYNDGTTATWQLQTYDDVYTKCVKVEMTQTGADISARAVYAKYISGSQIGIDFDSNGNIYTVATNETVMGYGVAATTLLPMKKCYEPFLTATPSTVLTNASLSDYSLIAGTLGGGAITDHLADAKPLHVQTNGNSRTIQFQAYNGNYTKCVKIELTQAGSDIAAKVLYAKYINKRDNNLTGYNFDAPGATDSNIATSFATHNYGVCQLRFSKGNQLKLTEANNWSGSTVIEGGILDIADAGLLGEGTYTNTIQNNGQLSYSGMFNQVLSGNISGSGTLVKYAGPSTPVPVTYASFLPKTPTTAIILENRSISDVIGADGFMGGSSITGGKTSADAFFFTNNGITATWQLQTTNDLPWTKCVKIQLTQSGPNIVATVLYAKYVNNGSVIGYDFDTQPASNNSVATSLTAGGYGAAETTLDVIPFPKLTLSGVNSYTGGTVVDGGTLEVTGMNSLPTTGGVIVNEGAELLFKNSGDPGIYASIGGNNSITLNGGLLTVSGKFAVGHQRAVINNGGVINSIITANDDNSNYMNNLILMNGAAITGYKIRVGYVSAPAITVAGTNACSIPSGINMVKNGTNPLTFNIADVTGDDTADLTIPGVIRDYTGEQYEYMPIVKTGAGTLSLSGINTHKGVFTITQGTLALDGDSALNANNNVVLSGGTLDMGDFENTAGTLAVNNNSSTLQLGTGIISFADSSAETWADTLTLTGTLMEQSVRFGTDNTGLTSDQLNAIDYNSGTKVYIDRNGYLTTAQPGTFILIQ